MWPGSRFFLGKGNLTSRRAPPCVAPVGPKFSGLWGRRKANRRKRRQDFVPLAVEEAELGG